MRPDWAVGGCKGSGLYPVIKETVKTKVISLNDEQHHVFKGVAEALKGIVFPPKSSSTVVAQENARKSRKRIQSAEGEILTSERGLARLNASKESKSMMRKKRKTKVSKKQAPSNKSNEIQAASNRLTTVKRNQNVMKGITPAQFGSLDILDWVVVSYNEKKHLAQINHINDQIANVSFVSYKKQVNDNSVFVWPENEDQLNADSKNVFGLVSAPVLLRRGELLFAVSGNVW